LSFEVFLILFTTLTILVARIATLQAPRGVRQMNGVPQSGADRSATAESCVRANWSNVFTVLFTLMFYSMHLPIVCKDLFETKLKKVWPF